VIADIQGEGASRLARSLGDRTLGLSCDVRKAEDLSSLVEQSLLRFGKIDGLVNNAGLNFVKPFLDTNAEEWDQVLSVDLRAVFLLTQLVCRQMLRQASGGSIVNISSVHSHSVLPGSGPYDAAKWGGGGAEQERSSGNGPRED
jgi:glucose 1-dehydrogenase